MNIFGRWLFLLLLFGLFLGQTARIQLDNGVAFSLMDSVVLLFVLWGVGSNMLSRKRVYDFTDPITKTAGVFVLVAVFSLAGNPLHLEPVQLLISSLYLSRWILYATLYAVITTMGRPTKLFIKSTLVAAGSGIVLVGYIQYAFYQNLRNLFYLGWDDHLYRMFSTFFDPNFAGAFFVLFLFFLLGLLILRKRELHSKLFYLLVVLSVFTTGAIFLTFSRSALLMLIGGSFTLFSLLGKKKYIFVILGIILIVFIISSRFFYLENINPFRIASSEARVESLKNASIIIQHYPILGVGFDSYRYAQIKYHLRGGALVMTSHAEAGTDNSFAFVFATTGIIGVISYLFFLGSIIRKAYKTFRDGKIMGAVVLASSVGLFIDSLFINSLFYPAFLLWMCVVVGIMDDR